MYSNVADLVPVFFKDVGVISQFAIHKNNSYSMTDLIRGDLFRYSGNQISSFAARARTGDKRQFEGSLNGIQKIVHEHDYVAITTDNIGHFASPGEFSEHSLASTRRVLSALYYEHYCEHNRTVTATGVPRLRGFVEDLTYFPHYDVPVLRRLLQLLDWSRLEYGTPNLLEQVLGTYHTREHWRFVAAIHGLLHACSEQVKFALSPAKVDQDSVSTFRATLVNALAATLDRARNLRELEVGSTLSFYQTAEDLVIKAAILAARSSHIFKSAWEATTAAQDYIPSTGFPNLDRKLTEVRDRLRLAPRLSESEIRDVLIVLVPLANFAGQLVADNLIKSVISELEFQVHIRQALRRDARIGNRLEEHPHAGGGIADLSFRGIRIELKSQGQKTLSLNDCRQFVDQASNYGVATGKRIAILCVLDCSKKVRPPFPVEEGIEIMVAQGHPSSTLVAVVLMQANLTRPSDHSR